MDNAPLLEVAIKIAESNLVAVLKLVLDLLPGSAELDCCPLCVMLSNLELPKDDPREIEPPNAGSDTDCELDVLLLETLLDKM